MKVASALQWLASPSTFFSTNLISLSTYFTFFSTSFYYHTIPDNKSNPIHHSSSGSVEFCQVMVMDPGFPCQVCPKSFASKSSLRHHTYTHNETEEVCNECGEVFSTKKNCTITRESTGKEKRPKWSSVITALMSQQALMSNDI